MAENKDVKGIESGGENNGPRGKNKIEGSKTEPKERKKISGSEKGGESGIKSDEKAFSIISHLSGFLMYLIPPFQIIIPLIIWLIKSDENPYIRHHARQSTFFQLLIIIAHLISGILCFVLIGFVLLPLVAIFHIVCTVLAALAASRGELYVYPVLGWFFEKLNIEK